MVSHKDKALPNVFEKEQGEQETKQEEYQLDYALPVQETPIDDIEPEAFIPSFQVAPEIVPPESQINIPTDEEKKATLDNLYSKLGMGKVKDFLDKPTQEITPEKEKTLGRVSMMGARIFSSVSMWAYSIFGYEYGVVAPTVDHSYKMILPMGRIAVRHSKFVGNVSPDVDDVIESLTAMSDYAVYAMGIMQEIREQKQNEQQGFNTYKARPSGGASGLNGTKETTPVSNEHAENGRVTSTVPNSNLDGYERYNYDMLQSLSKRDYEARLRRSGRF